MTLDSLDWLSEYSNVKTGNLFNSYIQVISGQGFSQHNFFGAQSHELFHFFMP